MALRLDQKTRLLAALPVFQSLEPEAVHVLAFSAREKAFSAGDVLFKAGDPSDGGLVIATGEVVMDPPGDTLPQRQFGPGALIGEAALISETERPATVTATIASTVLLLPRTLMLQILEAHPASAGRLRTFIAERLADQRATIRSLLG